MTNASEHTQINPYISLWHDVIRNASMDNTYKMAWSRAIVELCAEYEFSGKQCDDSIRFGLEHIAEKFFGYYWNQTFFFGMNEKYLQHSANASKPPKILGLVRNAIESYNESRKINTPVVFQKEPTTFMGNNTSEVVALLKENVSHRFLNFNGQKAELYVLNLPQNYIELSYHQVAALKSHKKLLIDLINFQWTLKLEQLNSAVPNLGKKVSFSRKEDMRRSSLTGFKPALKLVNPQCICAVCNNPISEDEISIDHVIPWSFMYSDDIWNLMLVHNHCNSSKSNREATCDMFSALAKQNQALLKKLKVNPDSYHGKPSGNKLIAELEYAENQNLLVRFRSLFNQ